MNPTLDTQIARLRELKAKYDNQDGAVLEFDIPTGVMDFYVKSEEMFDLIEILYEQIQGMMKNDDPDL